MKQMRAGKGAKVRVVASGGDSHSESRRALTFLKAIAPLQADEKSTTPLFTGERRSGEGEEVERVVTGRGN
jgi:hypothetical protein